jgi:hypothetical protein
MSARFMWKSTKTGPSWESAFGQFQEQSVEQTCEIFHFRYHVDTIAGAHKERGPRMDNSSSVC